MEKEYIRLKEIKPELADYLNSSLRIINYSQPIDSKEVHDLRVLLKKARAVLKLIASQVIPDYNVKDITSLREASKLMSDWRDNSVLRKILKDLRKEYPSLFGRLVNNEIINKLSVKNNETSIPLDADLTIAKIKELVHKTSYRIRFQNADAFDPNILLSELEKTYADAVKRFVFCRNDPTEKKLHAFRKKSKEFLYQVFFFRPLNNRAIKDLEDKLTGMTRNLGKLVDLFQLLKALDYKYYEVNPIELDELVVRIRERQDEHLRKVWPVASKIFCPGRKLASVLGYKTLII
ncbi:MAG TPA: CHAD domain-containing protein [Bacteroidales bacterium]|nr:CHAD domain-containing protein [Bacteroidales bacterium]